MSIRDTGCPISKEISIRNFHNDFKQEIVTECRLYSHAVDGVGSEIRMLTKDESVNLQVLENCNLDLLTCPSDKRLWEEIKIVSPRLKNELKQFKTYENFNKAMEHYHSVNELMHETGRLGGITKDLSYNNTRDIAADVDGNIDPNSLILDDVIVTVVVFKPVFEKYGDTGGTNLMKNLKPELQIDFLGSQTLDDLLSMITCRNGESMLGDFSDVMKDWTSHRVYAKDAYPGGFFLIENICYDIENGADLSSPIINWISKSSDRIERFGYLEKKSMKDVQLFDLRICLGKPYLYMHIGDCEHLFAFSDIKMMNKHHCQDPSKYPIITGKTQYQPIKCQFCETNNSDWLVTNCNITPTDKCPLCDFCLRMYLYDENHQKVTNCGDFKVFKVPAFT